LGEKLLSHGINKISETGAAKKGKSWHFYRKIAYHSLKIMEELGMDSKLWT
jgi:hypothetical protein